MAWTDKKNGYFRLSTQCIDDPSCGYWRDGTKYLSDFFIPLKSGEADLYRSNALYTDVMPEGFMSVFRTGTETISLKVSLLLDDQSLYVELANGTADFAPLLAGVGLLLPATSSVPEISGEQVWIRYSTDGFTCWQDDAGTAIISSSPFSIEILEKTKICLLPESDTASWYIVFEEDGENARKKASQLVRSNAIALHRAKISEFLEGCTINSGNSRFDDAVAWAQFAGWMLVTDEPEKEIKAGFPHFTEKFDRDMFISLSGILLVAGRFSEARFVLADFACRQNCDSSSREYGRIPQRFLDDNNEIYNTDDGTLWFIRSLWEYVQYSGDIGILDELGETVDRAIDADLKLRVDEHGFLKHGDAETWMEAKTKKGIPFSPRGDRACEIQALWYTALCVGSYIARLRGNAGLADARIECALRVKTAFNHFFWCDERNALADRLPPGPHGEWLRDFRVRPNQLFAITIPSILYSEHASFLDSTKQQQILENVSRELLSPFGVFSLSPDDPLFHPRHENPEWYDKNASVHNGTICVWNTGSFITASVLPASAPVLSSVNSALLYNEMAMILDSGCAGTLPENISAEPDEEGLPVFSGMLSNALGVAEFSRNACQDIIGFHPLLADNRIELHPHLPAGLTHVSAEPVFGPDWKLSIELDLRFASGTLVCLLVWKNVSRSADFHIPPLFVNGNKLLPGVPLELSFPIDPVFVYTAKGSLLSQPQNNYYRTSLFPERDFTPDWCSSIRSKNYLEKLLPLGVSPAFALEPFFDSDYFRRKYYCSYPLGVVYASGHTIFRLWAPTARSVSLLLYPDGTDSSPTVILPMQNLLSGSGGTGVWELSMNGDLHGVYYRFRVRIYGIIRDIEDPAARACGVNGKRSMVVDFTRTNPPGWNRVQPVKISSPNDVIAYEVHIADITSSPYWNGDSRVARTYTGAALRGTTFRGKPTGFDHILGLGITHVQLMPIFDFESVDENRLHDSSYENRLVGGRFNWGYDPENFSAPEGSYSTDPRDGLVRIRELKILIREFLSNGIGVIMDVVYNHVPAAQNHPLGVCVPGYYFRTGNFSGAGDDTASEREMFRKYMIDSLSWWLTEYKLSGFRFDLMGLHDVETMNAIATALRRIKSDVILYGEGWDMYRAGKMVPANMLQSRKLPDYGFFNDAFRCGIKGSVFQPYEGGFIHNGSHRESVKFGIVGAVYHQQVHNRLVDGTVNPNPWTDRTSSSVNYTEIHDNLTLFDKLVLVEPGQTDDYYEHLQKLAIGLVLLSQGMPVLHAGMEFMRTKEIPSELVVLNPSLKDLYRTQDGLHAFSHNSYNLSDLINGLDWLRCAEKQSLVSYVRKLIAVRKAHPLFRLQSAPEVVLSITFFELCPQLLCWVINGCTTVDTWDSVCIIINTSSVPVMCSLPACSNGGVWHLVTDGERFFTGNEPGFVGDYGPDRSQCIVPKTLYLYAEF